MKFERGAALFEAEVHWRTFLEGLRARGLCGIRMITSDDHSGLRAALKAVFHGTSWQRCPLRPQQNAHSYVPSIAMRREVAQMIRGIFNAPSRPEAERLLCSGVERHQERRHQALQLECLA